MSQSLADRLESELSCRDDQWCGSETCPRGCASAAKLIVEVAEVGRRDWAVRVLDAWASPGETPGLRYGVEFDEDEQRIECLLVGTRPVKNRAFYGPTPDSARLAAAEAVWPELPESVRAEIGAKP